jgi:hypothetical protein
MNYTKPEIAKCATALAAIQSIPPKGTGIVYDSFLRAYFGSISAYEADE